MYVGLAAWGWKWNVFTLVNKIKFLNLREELQPMELCLFPYKSLWGIFFFLQRGLKWHHLFCALIKNYIDLIWQLLSLFFLPAYF